jgi:cytochrome P450
MSNRSRRAAAIAQEFNPDELRRDGAKVSWGLLLLTCPFVMKLARMLRIVPLPGRTRWITRYDDVREALSQPHIFQVPFRVKMETLEPAGCPFILGLDGGASYAGPLDAIMKGFPLGDLGEIVRISKKAAEAALGNRKTKDFDAVKDLITAVPLQVYRDYYGLDTSNSDLALWLFAVSNYTFRQIGSDEVARPAALAGARNVLAAADTAIHEAKHGRKPSTVVKRLLDIQKEACAKNCSALTDEVLRTTLVGMISGYVPVSTLAGCHILEVLLRRKPAMTMAVNAARDDDDDLLQRCLLEALRLYPINPGPWRICAKDYTFVSRGGACRRIRRGTKVLVGTQSAMRDGRRVPSPGSFNPDRDASDSMVFGAGLHWCVGAPLAIAQMTQTFKALLRRAPVRRAGPTRYFGAIPESLSITFGKSR